VNGNVVPDIAGGISRGLQSVQQATIAAGQQGIQTAISGIKFPLTISLISYGPKG